MKPEQRAGIGRFVVRRRSDRIATIAILVLVIVALGRLIGGAGAAPPTAAARAHAVEESLACPICEGLSVADSPSALAQEMRTLVVEQIAAGKSDAQIEQYFVARYGPSILLTPPKQGFTALAWWVPILVIVLSTGAVGWAAYRWARRPRVAGEGLPALAPEEEQRYADVLARALAEEAGEDRPEAAESPPARERGGAWQRS